ncbi:hypothetical protein [Mesorhizobium sp. B2-4-1]|uniref:hypothetical protein n=1 Tax=Mesorhizobium sp. B2-4-1 TaxID=2589948 RepID=UPI00112B5592|nr:hypothetical protein [Mesorhizobium sp. B2-4-1]TPL66604.1 hypothetical protein FJ949_09565 [Mesorhizobium sp. B2-4-1]
MSEQADLDLLMDAVSDHMDIASQAGCPDLEICACTMQAVAQFLVSRMPVDQALAAMRDTCADLAARMPEIPEGKH